MLWQFRSVGMHYLSSIEQERIINVNILKVDRHVTEIQGRRRLVFSFLKLSSAWRGCRSGNCQIVCGRRMRRRRFCKQEGNRASSSPVVYFINSSGSGSRSLRFLFVPQTSAFYSSVVLGCCCCCYRRKYEILPFLVVFQETSVPSGSVLLAKIPMIKYNYSLTWL